MAEKTNSGTTRTATDKPVVRVPADVSNHDSSKLDDARERLQEVAGQIEERYRQVSDEVRKGAEKASTEVRRGAEKASKEVRRGAKVARERSAEAAEQLRHGYGRAREQAQSLSQNLSDYVQEKPGTALLTAAAAGFLVGLLFRRRGGGE